MTGKVIIWASGFLTGLVMAAMASRPPRDRDNNWRRSINLEEGRIVRGNGNGGPTTPKPSAIPKPQPPRGRVIDVYGQTIGFVPLPWSGSTTPPRNP